MKLREMCNCIHVVICIYTCQVKCACSVDEDSHTCEGTEICYGGTSGVDAADVLCMTSNACSTAYKIDTCDECEQNPDKHANGSRYMDCAGTCYRPDNVGSMLAVDQCGVCGGTNTTCNPTVTTSVLDLLPDSADTTFSITGTSFRTPNLQILLISSGHDLNRRRRRFSSPGLNSSVEINEHFEWLIDTVPTAEVMDMHRLVRNVQEHDTHERLKRTLNEFASQNVKEVAAVLEIVNIIDDTTMDVRVQDIPAGEYEIGARTGDAGLEYEKQTGPTLTLYAESDYTLDSMSPSEQTIGGTSTVEVTLQLSTISDSLSISDIYDITRQFKCFFSNIRDAVLAIEAQSNVIGVFDRSLTQLACVVDIPEVADVTWVCASFNAIHLIGCKDMTFFETAPTPESDTLKFTETGDGLYVVFNKPVSVSVRAPCTTYFTDVGAFGLNPVCPFNEAGDRLFVQLGDSSTIQPDDTVELKAGLEAVTTYTRSSTAITLTVVIPDVIPRDSIVIVPRGSWPTTLTSSAKDLYTLEIVILKSPGNRRPKSIIWEVNDVVQALAANKLSLEVDVASVGEYVIDVTVTDLLGGEAVISHTLNRIDADLPTIVFSTIGMTELSNGQFQAYPNTQFVIYTRISYVDVGDSGLEAYSFQWSRNGLTVAGRYYMKSTKDENTIDMCGESVVYSVLVSATDNSLNNIEYTLAVLITCRDPVALITGNAAVDVDVTDDDITIIGGMSNDPDGGNLTYSWTCSTPGDNGCIAKITSTTLSSTTFSSLTISPTRMTAGKSYALTLTVNIEKSGVRYSDADVVTYMAGAGNKPVVRWVTMRTTFRHSAPIMMKAYVGKDVTVAWKFSDHLVLYEWADAQSEAIGKSSKVTEGFAWFTIRPDVLTPGRQYRLELNVTYKSGSFFVSEYDIRIYELLRGCSIEAENMVELEESSISLRSCLHDSEVKWLSTMCRVGEREIQLSPILTFIVPVFPTGTTTAILRCKIEDSLGNMMDVNSTVVTVTTAQGKTARQALEQLKETGDLLGALDVMSDMSNADSTVYKEAVELIEEIVHANPTPVDIRRTLNSLNRLNVDVLESVERDVLADSVQEMLNRLCNENEESAATTLTSADIKDIIDKTKELVIGERKLGPWFRGVQDKLACIKFKWMQNEDHELVVFDDGGTYNYLVNTLDDVKEFGVDVEFPEELMSKYRDQWNCGESQICHGVGLKMAEYMSEPPDLKHGREDLKCSRYVSVDIYNQNTGVSVGVRYLSKADLLAEVADLHGISRFPDDIALIDVKQSFYQKCRIPYYTIQ